MPKLLPIITDPNEILRKSSKPINANTIKNKTLGELCDNMAFTMLKKDGIGLAAPQIGRNDRIVIINTRGGSVCMINPEIEKKSLQKEWGDEGCLSVPNKFGSVKRHKKITCSYIDKDGSKQKVEARGLMARVIQHEIDHLDGILFTDKAINIQENGEAS